MQLLFLQAAERDSRVDPGDQVVVMQHIDALERPLGECGEHLLERRLARDGCYFGFDERLNGPQAPVIAGARLMRLVKGCMVDGFTPPVDLRGVMAADGDFFLVVAIFTR